jgi:23S rRNA (adenine2503-C2)-methyltransferase
MESRKNIRHLSLTELQEYFVSLGEKPFRAKQVYEWLWEKSAHSFEQMTSLSKELRTLLVNNFDIHPAKITSTNISKDGTEKYAFELYDENIIEGVLIPSDDRYTACISTQVGCNFSCKFCATGKLGWKRNLNLDEMVDQVSLINQQVEKQFKSHLSNIVFMGMGEPLLNYDHLLKAIDRICAEDGLGISPRRITVSTVGIAKMIKRLGDDQVKFNLALSLHAANDDKRSKVMSVNETNSLRQLAEALKYFYKKTETRITFEYLLLKGFNDSIDDAMELAAFCKNVPCKVNIIEYNPVEETGFKKTDRKELHTFVSLLESKNLIVNIRYSRGKDIDAACGQLANKIKKS